MGLQDWNWRLPAEHQDVPWDCACASTSWALRTVGREWSEADVVNSMYPSYVNPYYGLLDASGAGLVDWLSSIGVGADYNPAATWDELVAAAGHQPVVMGGRTWCHWTGVRIPGEPFRESLAGYVALANPAPGWYGIDQVMSAQEYEDLGQFSVVWFTSW